MVIVERSCAAFDNPRRSGSSPRESRGDAAERVADLAAEKRDGDDADHRDQADQQAVFDESRTLFVPAKPVHQLEEVDLHHFKHAKILSEVEVIDRIRAAWPASTYYPSVIQESGDEDVSKNFYKMLRAYR